MTLQYSLYDEVNEYMVTYYFGTMLLLLLPTLYYMLFRSNMKTWIKHHVSKTIVKNEKKGMKNFWWYEGIHAKSCLGWKYHVNKVFTITYAATMGIHILLGWIGIVTVLVMAGSAAICIMTAVMAIYSRLQDNMEYHGSPFVLFARSINGGLDSVLFDIISAALPLGCGYAQLILFLNVHNINGSSI